MAVALRTSRLDELERQNREMTKQLKEQSAKIEQLEKDFSILKEMVNRPESKPSPVLAGLPSVPPVVKKVKPPQRPVAYFPALPKDLKSKYLFVTLGEDGETYCATFATVQRQLAERLSKLGYVIRCVAEGDTQKSYNLKSGDVVIQFYLHLGLGETHGVRISKDIKFIGENKDFFKKIRIVNGDYFQKFGTSPDDFVLIMHNETRAKLMDGKKVDSEYVQEYKLAEFTHCDETALQQWLIN